ncbi:MAG: Mrp/NBP35 family ATP-binding protein [Desulfobacterales bacterium]|nr:Mrp/NBP35 family ATP-binding protein [Desulfobacterales bacterium]
MSSSCKTKTCPGKESTKGATCGAAKASVAIQDLAIQGALNRIRYKILVMSGKGGVGKSTVAVNLAMGLADKGHKVGLMDVDLHGPDICRMLGLTGKMQFVEKTEKGLVPPMRYNDKLKVISLEYMMEDRDEAIIWRGPLKLHAIRQFIADMDWGELDFLVIDAPPGTGDEPLSIAQNIKDVNALIVTTPQEVALADVRKSINFCRQLKMKVIGLVENMSGFVCPHCHQGVDIFKSGGGRKTALEFSLPFLGKVPMDPRVVTGGDAGKPYLSSRADTVATRAFAEVVANVAKALPVGKTVGNGQQAMGS